MRYIGLFAQLDTDAVRKYCGIWASPSECKMLHKTECRCCLDGSATLGCCKRTMGRSCFSAAHVHKEVIVAYPCIDVVVCRIDPVCPGHELCRCSSTCLLMVFRFFPYANHLGVGKRFPVTRGHSCNDDLSACRLMTQ